jgi:hypothetical protein
VAVFTVRRGRGRTLSIWSPFRANDFTEDFMAERGDGRFADGQTMLRQQFGNRPVGSALLPKLDDDFPCRGQFLELLWPARREFRDRLPDGGWVK